MAESDKSFHGWRILQEFPAQGGEADVFLAEKDGQRRILKLYRFGVNPRKEALDIVARLGDHNPGLVVRLFDHGLDADSGRYFELDEYLPGGTLADRLGSRPLSEGEVQSIVRQLLPVLEELHGQGLLHLDLKPGNLLVRSTDPFAVALSDFGLSSLWDGAVSQKFTQTRGTSWYQSPESITGAVSPKSDWWSLGIMLLELLLRRNPFEGIQPQVVHYQLTTKGVEIPPDLPTRWRNILMGLLTRRPEKRWGGDEVRRWLAGEELETSYQDETSQVQGKEALSSPAQFKRFSDPFPFRGTFFESLEDLVGVALSSPQAWDECSSAIAGGEIVAWLEKNGDPQRADQIRKVVEKFEDPDLRVFQLGILMRPDLPFVWRGKALDADCMRKTLESYPERLDSGDRILVEELLSEGIFLDYARLTGRNLGDLEKYLRLAKGMQDTGLERIPCRDRVVLLLRAHDGALSGSRALDALRAMITGTPETERGDLQLFQKDGVDSFAKKASLWNPGDDDLWSVVFRISKSMVALENVNLDGFFGNSHEVLAQMRRDPGVGEFLVRLFSKPDLDQLFIRRIVEHANACPAIGSLVRAIFQLSGEESLEILLEHKRIQGILISRWDEISGRFLIPPFLSGLKAGGILSLEHLRIAHRILENPDLLPEKTCDQEIWDVMLKNLDVSWDVDTETEEFFLWVKKERERRKNRELALTWAVRCFVLSIALFFVRLMNMPGFVKDRNQAREKACYANMRVIIGAVEMYNMDHSEMLTRYNDQQTMEFLVSKKYIKWPIERPEEGCRYLSEGDLTLRGNICCDVHGPLSDFPQR